MISVLNPRLSPGAGKPASWGQLYGSALALAAVSAAQQHDRPVVIVCHTAQEATRLEYAIKFYSSTQADERIPVLPFPDWETLPYDVFSPHQDIISQRLSTLYQLPQSRQCILIVPVATLMHRLPPCTYIQSQSFIFNLGDNIDLDNFRRDLENRGYQCVSQVMEHGEFAVRGGIIDLYPMGSGKPLRLELFDDEIESIRSFNPENQRSLDKVERIHLLPGREFPLTEEAVNVFRHAFRTRFEGDPQRSTIYKDVSQRLAPAGIEYYLPLFFENMATLFDYLPSNSLVLTSEATEEAADQFWKDITHRYEQRRVDPERPLLAPENVFLQRNEIFACIDKFPHVKTHHFTIENLPGSHNFATQAPPLLTISARTSDPLAQIKNYIREFPGRILIAAETTGRREALLELFHQHELFPNKVQDWSDFLTQECKFAICVAPLDEGLVLQQPDIAVISEPQLFGEQAMQRRRRKSKGRDSDQVIRDLSELRPGAPVVHEEHGVGRYLGLQTIPVGDVNQEFLTLEYADKAKLYVPVASLHFISRYTGSAPENAPLHRLGSEQWAKARRKAAERARDVAAELLDIYARREARKGHCFHKTDDDYAAFSAAFPFEETPDQANAILDVLSDMTTDKPMDRLVCGDVGFGKTEVAMRAAFLAVHDQHQVAVLVPTTLLAQQHYQNFKDRFADWPFNIEVVSRFRNKKEQDAVIKGLQEGKIDIVIGTHKLIQSDIKFKKLGLVIIDEEHRFGVRQKERFKALRSEVDILTMTATPIPRTLNMALSELRALSIIATPPSQRLAIKTQVTEWRPALIQEAMMRELRRGGQVYFLHNEVETIEKTAAKITELIPEARVGIAHGQMRERELERVMLDFYHQRFNVLVCTTIIETGIDVPTANTIIINRADRFGLAQLYQLRGRVGRSHHRAYALLITPPKKTLTADAEKRLEAISSLEELGAGFTLAMHDLEIRGAGELLGDEQSGQIQEIGFSLYSEMLERAVKALKSGKTPELDKPLHSGAEIDLKIPALIPEDYLPDVHSRLVMYKRIANAADPNALRELQVEMIDRFGLLPDATKQLFHITGLKLKAQPLGVKRIDAGPESGRIVFEDKPNLDPMVIIQLIQTEAQTFRLDGQDKLRFIMPMDDPEKRIEAVSNVLDRLSAPPA